MIGLTTVRYPLRANNNVRGEGASVKSHDRPIHNLARHLLYSTCKFEVLAMASKPLWHIIYKLSVEKWLASKSTTCTTVM